MTKKFMFILSVIALVAWSCSKTGPAGPAGAPGTNGTNGTNGINGADGTTILSGSGAPSASIGNVGDFYFDVAGTMFYGPKTSSGWGSGIELKGTNGTNGTNGATILSGSGAPSASVGNIGDFYFDTTDVVFYGPKSATDWGNQISLRSDSSSVKTYILNEGFDNIQLQSQQRCYVLTSPTTVDSLNVYAYTYSANTALDLKSIVPNFDYIMQNGLAVFSITPLIPDNGDIDQDFLPNIDQYSFTESINDSTYYDIDYTFKNDTLSFPTELHAGSSSWNSTFSDLEVTGGRPAGYNADDFRNKTFYQLKLVFIPPSQVTTLSAAGVNVKDAAAIKRALNLH